ncbi:hypothetical protein IU479_24730 [Nocardia abscessus]|uniref:hypothetical protein n=1 Tax=Nocardia TaxID=1817 RepID=UPI0015EF26BF|nr:MULTISPECIES: hypothetical protein [Nocardia]MBF6221311.1 hypothetical protein [Nocardia abscessus]MBF6475776.1 hypothetical protein [Nocardia abscessus]MDE1671389.1 hypothetical protein [Nocardia gipuzkoensis]
MPRDPVVPETPPAARDRADLAAWRRRDALRRSNAARPIPSKRQYRRRSKHGKADTAY